MSNTISEKLLVLLFLLFSTFFLSVGVASALLTKLQDDAKTLNTIATVRASSQRLVIALPRALKEKIIGSTSAQLRELDERSIRTKSLYLSKAVFSKNYQAFKSFWAELKKESLAEEMVPERAVELAQKCWASATAAADEAELISRARYEEVLRTLLGMALFTLALLFFIIVVIYTQVKKKLEVRVMRDPLTQLYNRNYFVEQLQSTIKANLRLHHPFCLIFIDIDHFKRVNDRFGHRVGDEVLLHFSALLGRILRETDSAFRYGGEEFVVLSKFTDEKEAYLLCERIRKSVEAYLFHKDFSLTISLGLCQYRQEYSLDELISHADEAMYKAKTTGRNRSCVYEN